MILSMAGILAALIALGVVAVLAWFAYSLIFKRIYRARHLRRLELDRLIREAAERGIAEEEGRKQ